jgi:hypothetical protein
LRLHARIQPGRRQRERAHGEHLRLELQFRFDDRLGVRLRRERLGFEFGRLRGLRVEFGQRFGLRLKLSVGKQRGSSLRIRER